MSILSRWNTRGWIAYILLRVLECRIIRSLPRVPSIVESGTRVEANACAPFDSPVVFYDCCWNMHLTVRGSRVYTTVWEPHVVKEFIAIQESGNSHHCTPLLFTAATSTLHGVVVGHLPRKISKACMPLLYFTRQLIHLRLTRHLAHSSAFWWTRVVNFFE